ncbi:hypothetical protein Bpfe_007639 [Biomphalaria pfeifferi]|uniref:Uncharacterized protein n=1 Tax=Biomphalaria pfeifferi TaxID=112525 RepID=A0AAD8C003_BIOPF|nr:hypothetical protein Bpfe_007639 [Biomphalaria pfeifferi]
MNDGSLSSWSQRLKAEKMSRGGAHWAMEPLPGWTLNVLIDKLWCRPPSLVCLLEGSGAIEDGRDKRVVAYGAPRIHDCLKLA